MDKFYAYLSEKGIQAGPDVFQVLDAMEPDQLIEFAQQCYLLTETSRTEKTSDTGFNYSASTSISGGVTPCSSIECRLQNVYEMAFFAGLYADRVTIPNYFEYIHDHQFAFKNEDQFMFFLSRFAGDIVLMMDLKPLMMRGIIEINPRMHAYCADCLVKKIAKEKEVHDQARAVGKILRKEMLENIVFTMDTPYSITAQHPAGYVNFDAMRFAITPPEFKKYAKKAPYRFNKNEAKLLGLTDYILDRIIDDVILQKIFSAPLNSVYLTNQSLEGSVIRAMLPAEQDVASNVLVNGFVHELPFLQNVSLESIASLRDKEAESFNLYRESLRTTLNGLAHETDEAVVRDAVREKIAPELVKINRIIETNRSDFRSRIGKSIIADALMVSAGHFVFGWDIGGLATAVGVREFVSGTGIQPKVPLEAENNHYYFLWKLKKGLTPLH